jgi:hypothetical protein
MPLASLDRVTLTRSQRRALKCLVRAGRTEQRLVTRARRGDDRWRAPRRMSNICPKTTWDTKRPDS